MPPLPSGPHVRRRVGRYGLLVAGVAVVVAVWWRNRSDESTSARHRPPPTEAIARALAQGPTLRALRGDPGAASLPTASRIEGIVVDAAGRPVAHALVTVVDTALVATSGDDGWFELSVQRAGELRLAAQAGSEVGFGYYVVGTPEPAVVVLRPGAEVRVKVSVYGQPVVDAEVTLRHLLTVHGRTDDAGLFVARGVHPGFVAVEASAVGFAAARRVEDIPHGGKEVVLELNAGVEVAGRVIDEQGRPVADAEVLVAYVDALNEELPRVALTDARGNFVALLSRGEPVLLVARHDAYLQSVTAPLLVPNDGPWQGPKPELVLHAGATVRGRVVDRTGAAVSGAEVMLVEESGGLAVDRMRTTRAGDAGEFTFLAVQATSLELRAAHATGRREQVRFEMPPGEAIELRLEETATVRGKVVDRNGAAAPHAQILAVRDDDGEQDFSRRLVTASDAEGRFELTGLAQTPYRVLAAGADVLADPWRAKDAILVSPGQGDVVISLVAGTKVVGRAEHQDGTPLRGKVRLGPQAPVPLVDGGFVIDDVPEGTYALGISGVGGDEAFRPEVAVAGALVELGTIVVPSAELVRGRVVDERGQAVAGARVLVGAAMWLDGQTPARLVAERSGELLLGGADGAFSLRVQPGQGLALRADAAGMRSWATLIPEPRDPSQPVLLVVSPTAAIAGRVLDLEGRGVSTSLRLTSAGGQVLYFRTAPDGRFAHAGLPHGRYRLSEDQEIDATAGDSPSRGARDGRVLELTLTPGQTLTDLVVRAASD